MSTNRRLALALVLAFGTVAIACSESTDSTGTGGSSGSGGSGGNTGGRGGSTGGSSGSGGSTGGSNAGGSGGSTGGSSGSGGSGGSSTGGSGGAGGSAGSGGSGGSGGGGSGGSGGAGGSGGSGGSSADAGKMDTMGDASGTEGGGNTGAFTFMSPDFLPISGGRLCHKKEQTSSGGQVSPGLMWSGLPADTKSIVVSLKDRNGGTHWLMCNIAPTVMGLPRDINKSMKPEGSSNTGSWYGPGAGLPYRTYEYRVWAMKVPMVAGCTKGLYPANLMTNSIAFKEILVVGTAAGTCPN